MTTAAMATYAYDQIDQARTEPGLVLHEIWLLRLRALLARAYGTRLVPGVSRIATAPWPHHWASRGT